MNGESIFLASARICAATEGGSGSFVHRDGEIFYRIENYPSMPPFFMALTSGFDHWMFLSSNGGITCGRRDADNALFPYETDDRIHDCHAVSGPMTALRVSRGERTHLWQPFADELSVYRIERHLYKNQTGNRIVFEEINHDLELVFAYNWSSGDRYGFIRRSSLVNTGTGKVRVEFLDGLRNLLPYGVSRHLQANMSTLLDAYKQSELLDASCLAIYSLSSIPTDRAEPSEALKATTAWCHGLDQPQVLLSTDQVNGFCRGQPVQAETASRGRRGAFIVHSSLLLAPAKQASWYLLADVEQSAAALSARLEEIGQGVSVLDIEQDIDRGTARIQRLAAAADGFQLSSDAMAVSRHFFNTLFNIMRGGTFVHDYRFPGDRFLEFAADWNRDSATAIRAILDSLGPMPELQDLFSAATDSGDADLQRLVLEYLPLMFSRRHGDPSRPWNHFKIDLRDEDGSDRLCYEGNWRDIFQNWEALAISYPEFIESFVAKFVNASTADGYNPYRIGSDSFDWEVLDPGDPWSNIGYWGDHQVNYLARLLELSRRYHPGKLAGLLDRELFVYANLPYRIKPYAEIVSDPRNTIVYDESVAKAIAQRVLGTGQDGKLLRRSDGELHRAGLLEKLLVPVLAKVSNLVPGGGIWMNTQRPEWNDANNALTGYGLSMVTLCYLRRYVSCLADLLEEAEEEAFGVSAEVCDYFDGLFGQLKRAEPILAGDFGAEERRAFMLGLGVVTDRYRQRVYNAPKGRKQPLAASDLLGFCALLMRYLDHSIARNRRADGLFHSYNLLSFNEQGTGIEHLDEMLEGQVAVMSSGFLGARQCTKLLRALRESRLYRADKNSYILYPDRQLPAFLDKNRLPAEAVSNSEWIRRELASGRTRFVQRDAAGAVRFNGRFRNAGQLAGALAQAGDVAERDAKALCEWFESIFQHRRFTGRSGTMYKYEGLGCIYWHMVSKLLLATAEVIESAGREGASESVCDELAEHFHSIEEGLGVYGTPAEYGAFPSDPYSHTPGFMGVQQPGMTGQVKEDVITRFRELGVRVDGGQLSFLPALLRRQEFTGDSAAFSLPGEDGSIKIDIGPDSLAFSLCGVPVVYRLAERASILVETRGGAQERIDGSCLGRAWSESLFRRRKEMLALWVDIPRESLR